jgi:ATP-binding cassette subfamily B protein
LDNDEIIENKGTLHPERFEGDVEFKNVWFSYNEIEGNPDEYDAWILKDVSFKLNAGKTMAIVGSTGSGKSTIINLLSRFYEIQKGDILVDGNNAKLYELHALRSRIAVVLQDVFLFNGSVLDNITLRNNNISRERVMEAAQMIGAHDFITALPNGYDYIVQERGATLSMGQRQLISFVRALVFDPDILILDEATSSVDPQTESVIQYAIEQLIQKRTSIIIAHRLSTIRHADAVMVLEKGKVLEVGSPQELLQNENGHYRKLYDMQFAEVL